MSLSNGQIGVFICHCGGNISDVVDIQSVKQEIELDNISVFDCEYLCSNIGQDLIRKSIDKHSLDKIVIGACTPVKHEKLFLKCIEDVGLNASMLEIANLREQCSWVHPDNLAATNKSISLLIGKIKRVQLALPLTPIQVSINPNAMVIGGGIAGINSALNLANNGIHTYLIEKDVTIGGNAAKIGKIFSPEKLAEECAMCSLSPLMNEIGTHPNITLLTYAEVENVSGSAGDFKVNIRKKPRYVKDNCMACGRCSEVCPVYVENDFNCGVKDKKAISMRFAQSVPQVYSIDSDHCIELTGGECGICRNVCKVDAIDFEQREENIELDVGAIIVATGFDEYDASKKPQYGYGIFENIVTQMDLARILGVNGPTLGKLARPSDNSVPKNIVMIQCVGSRDEDKSGNRYCSRYCCMAALKHASLIAKKYPDTNVTICYIDIRAFGLYENYYRAVQDMGISFVRGRPAEVIQKANHSLVVKVEDTLTQELKEMPADMVVLSSAMEASSGTKQIANILNVTLSEDGFVKEKHSKLKSVDTSRDGIFVCGTAQSPKDVTDTITQSGLAAARTSAFILDKEIRLDPQIAQIDHSLCNNCDECFKCPFGGISKDVSGKVSINPLVCNGCGYCAKLCSKSAISITGYKEEQIIAEIDGVIEKGDVLAFLSRGIPYATADNIGNSVAQYPANVKIVRVPTTTIVTQAMIEYAFEHGSRAVLMVEEPTDNSIGAFIYPLAFENFKDLKNELGETGAKLHFKKAYIPHYRGLAEIFTYLTEMEDEK
ncbi:MAG: FAD-dependent oxidoreductase [Methanosarcinaceae archaeon]|nr:FAD-dependent oxidoreductase [Methanosarcinaceae archaeon]